MRRTIGTFAGLAFIMSLAVAGSASALDISGGGSTFAYPLMTKWAEAYKAKAGDEIRYKATGSGLGIKEVQGQTIDFGASDMPLKPDELEKMDLVQFPVMIGGVVPVVNLGDVAPGAIKLDGPTLANIYLGKISRWNNPAIAVLNPTLKLPDIPIVVVFRSDGSGTTFIFTDYLSKISLEWRDKIGAYTTVSFPTGTGRAGNDGVATTTVRTLGAIGYVEYTYAKRSKLTYAAMKNGAGEYVLPTAAAFKAAASSADWTKAPSYYLLLTDQPGAHSWPMAGSTFALVRRSQADVERTRAIFKFFEWAYKDGAALAEQLDYVPIQGEVIRHIGDTWRGVKTPNGQSVWTVPRS